MYVETNISWNKMKSWYSDYYKWLYYRKETADIVIRNWLCCYIFYKNK